MAANITLPAITLGNDVVVNQQVNVKYRLTSDPDVAASYTDLGNFSVNPDGTFTAPIVISGLAYSSNYTVWITILCSNSSALRSFNTIAAPFLNVAINGLYTRNNCPPGFSGTTIFVHIDAGVYSSSVDQATADGLAQAAAQAQANDPSTGGKCLDSSRYSTILIDYLFDNTADLCAYVKTTGLDETDIIVTGTAESPAGPLQLPNDGRDPATCYLLSSDKLTGGSPSWRFGINLAYFIAKYNGILTSIDFEIRGRSSTVSSIGGNYDPRYITEGVLQLTGSTGAKIPSVTMGTSIPESYSTNIVGGADGTVGRSVGSPILTLTYTFGTNALTAVTY